MTRFSAVLLMAGTGRRISLPYNKLLYRINDQELFLIGLKPFLGFSDVILVVNESDFSYVTSLVSKYQNIRVVLGGATRLNSAFNGVKEAQHEYVLIHDLARVLTTESDIERLLEIYHNGYTGLALLVAKLKHSLFDAEFNYLDRSIHYNALTPQIVLKALYLEAFNNLPESTKASLTDDISLCLAYRKLEVKVVEVESDFKLTTSSDLLFLKSLFERKKIKIGHSFDIHPFCDDKPLYLGGILIPNVRGLKAHSDGDVLLHALAEAIIGALGLGDLGDHFSDRDPKNKDLRSTVIISYVKDLLAKYNYQIVNIDVLVYSESLKITSFKEAIKKEISKILEINLSLINIKATTTEKLGVIGSDQALASEVVLLLEEV